MLWYPILQWAYPYPLFHLLRLLWYRSCYLPRLSKLGCKTCHGVTEVARTVKSHIQFSFFRRYSSGWAQRGKSCLKQEKKRELHEPRENSANSWGTLREWAAWNTSSAHKTTSERRGSRLTATASENFSPPYSTRTKITKVSRNTTTLKPSPAQIYMPNTARIQQPAGAS